MYDLCHRCKKRTVGSGGETCREHRHYFCQQCKTQINFSSMDRCTRCCQVLCDNASMCGGSGSTFLPCGVHRVCAWCTPHHQEGPAHSRCATCLFAYACQMGKCSRCRKHSCVLTSTTCGSNTICGGCRLKHTSVECHACKEPMCNCSLMLPSPCKACGKHMCASCKRKGLGDTYCPHCDCGGCDCTMFKRCRHCGVRNRTVFQQIVPKRRTTGRLRHIKTKICDDCFAKATAEAN